MSTLRINNIEAQSVPASPTIDEKVKVTNSSGDILVNIDGKTSGITTIGINTTDGNIKFDANSNVLITGILTATTLAGNFTPDSLEVGSNIKLGNAGVITATNFKSGVTNVHNLGVTLTGGQLDVGSNIKLGTAGVVTATSFVGSGANLTGITQTTINNNANNRLITGSGTANTLEAESGLTFDGSTLSLSPASSNAGRVTIFGSEGQDARLSLISDEGDDHIDQYNLRVAASNNRFYIDQFESGAFQERFTIANGGNIGIGTDNPAKKLEVFDTTQGVIRIRGGAGGSNSSRKADLSLFASGAREYVVRADASDAAFKIVDVSGSNAERMVINSSGNLLVGSAAIQYAQAPFYASGTDPVIAAFHHSDGGTNDEARISLGALANNPPYNRGVNLVGLNNGAGHDFVVQCSASHSAGPGEKVRVKSSGGLTFNGDTAAANALDDYEEGSYVVSVTGSGSGSFALNPNSFRYTKIGRVVHVSGRFYVVSGSPTGAEVRVSLPFTASSHIQSQDGAAYSYVSTWNAYSPNNDYQMSNSVIANSAYSVLLWVVPGGHWQSVSPSSHMNQRNAYYGFDFSYTTAT